MSKVDFYDLSNLKPLDLDKVEKQLNVKKHGSDAGKAEQPSSSATQFDDNERDIIGQLQSHRADIRADHSKRLQALDSTIAAQKSKVLSELHISDARNRFTALKQELKSGRRGLMNAQENFASAKMTLDVFRQKRNISDVPPPEKGIVDKFAILIFFVVVEALANLFFFAEGNEFGVVGGYLIAIAISVFNVFLFYFLGLFFLKFINSISWPLKLVGVVSWVFTLTALPLFHGLIAFYRQGSVAHSANEIKLSSLELTKIAWQNLKSLNFDAIDLTSIGLFVVGVGFGLYAAYKGFKTGHPYPGYDPRYKVYKSHEDKLEQAEGEFRGRYVDAIHDVFKKLKGVVSNQSSVKASLQKLHSQKIEILRRVDLVDEELSENCNTLLSRYRAANRLARTSSAPKYFDTLFVSRDHFGEGSAGKDYDAMIGFSTSAYDISGAEKKAAALLEEMEAMENELDQIMDSA